MIDESVSFSSAAYRLCFHEDVKCGSGLCVPSSKKCDGYFDCRDKTDEDGCNITSCYLDQIRCKTTDRCVNRDQRCDHKNDCGDNSDEEDCGEYFSRQYSRRHIASNLQNKC